MYTRDRLRALRGDLRPHHESRQFKAGHANINYSSTIVNLYLRSHMEPMRFSLEIPWDPTWDRSLLLVIPQLVNNLIIIIIINN